MSQGFLSVPREPFDWKSVEPFYQKLLEEDLTSERVPSWLEEWSELEKIVYEAHTAAQRAKHESTADEDAEKNYLAFIEKVVPPASRFSQQLTQKLLVVDYQPLPEHEQMLKRFRNAAELFREENIAVAQTIETLLSQYEKFNGALMVELDGEKLTIPQTGAKLQEPDRALRERAWRGVMSAQGSVSRELDKLFLELVRRRDELAKNAGLDNYRSYAWKNFNRFDYTPEDCLEFITSIEHEVTPVLAKMWEKRQRQLGVEDVRPWDLSADPDSRSPLKPFTTVTELEDGLERIFTNLDPVLGEQFASLREGWLDLEGRPNKLSGIGYCMDFPVSKMPFIYHNVNGTNTDVWVMLHEVGHAFQVFAFDNNLIWNRWPSTEFCEVASQAMELLTLPYLAKDKGGFYNAEDAARARENQLLRVLGIFPSTAQQAAFQHWLYMQDPSMLTLEQIDEYWLTLGPRFYPYVNWRGLDDVRCKGWQFLAVHHPFYDLDYAIAYLGAIQIWQNSLKDKKKALEQYRYALSLGASRPLPELFEAAGAKFSFDRKTVRDLVGSVVSQMD
jgi:oligoendopeptidase F